MHQSSDGPPPSTYRERLAIQTASHSTAPRALVPSRPIPGGQSVGWLPSCSHPPHPPRAQPCGQQVKVDSPRPARRSTLRVVGLRRASRVRSASTTGRPPVRPSLACDTGYRAKKKLPQPLTPSPPPAPPPLQGPPTRGRCARVPASAARGERGEQGVWSVGVNPRPPPPPPPDPRRAPVAPRSLPLLVCTYCTVLNCSCSMRRARVLEPLDK